jgi:hypothetical protein
VPSCGCRQSDSLLIALTVVLPSRSQSVRATRMAMPGNQWQG